ncbi:FAD-dependent oxidoreductase [Paragemmobacter straminiformis]|uniref:FAD-dependent oxidoreductase n=1 Tax=Paragemmobacter straminiformis TaxID=2045119 RepID=A0A842IAS0_9RHOB|nr:FAD-dependent oxidoreductase [Gemmobacter straminiformis]MBC2836689.1 FAD-dependent oxidoreductase [Gemmobacter straminiformis]
MPRDPRFDILFEPVRIGPKLARNRFFQVPHASGMTNAAPHVRAAFREAKAEGGWAVVSTGACSVDPSSDDSPFPFATLWDQADVRSHALMTEAAHRHGSLAAVELWHGGAAAVNRTTRHAPLSPSGIPWMATHVPFMSSARPRVMDAADIRNLIRWHAEAAIKAEEAGFDILYVYAGMGYLPYQFLLSDYNQRTDSYGGSVRNRVRLVEQLIDAVREATKGRCAVALRISMQELRARPSDVAPTEAHEVIGYLKDAPDLFDVKMDYSAFDCAASRYTAEGSHEAVVDFLKSVTDKPVVGVGRFTSPDTMVSMIRRGVLDFIGGARPSIADPFLPKKIEEGRVEDIRECIGCNLCISSWHDGVWVRCTQNPTAGEEWRRGWHPEIVRRDASGSVLVVGAGPSGLEAALTLARRGHEVALADRARDFGGRLRWESRLPGLGQWHRVVDYRMGQLRKLPNVSLYPESELSAADVRDFGADHVVIATGARWLPHLCGTNELPSGPLVAPRVYTPDDLAAGAVPEGPVAVFDYDNYYLGSAVAESLAHLGVTYITTAGAAAAWGFMTNEQPLVHQSFAAKGIALRTLEVVTGFDGEEVRLAQIFSGEERRIAARSLVIVGYRAGGSALHAALAEDAAPRRLHLTGDANAPGAIVHAIYQGHKTARELGVEKVVVRRDAPFAARDFQLPEAAE